MSGVDEYLDTLNHLTKRSTQSVQNGNDIIIKWFEKYILEQTKTIIGFEGFHPISIFRHVPSKKKGCQKGSFFVL